MLHRLQQSFPFRLRNRIAQPELRALMLRRSYRRTGLLHLDMMGQDCRPVNQIHRPFQYIFQFLIVPGQ